MNADASEAVIAKVRGVYARWRRDTPVSQMRADWDDLFAREVAAEVDLELVGGVACKWVRPEKARRDAVIVYLHGGGFRMGSTVSHLELMARLATEAGAPALGVDYRLAPEHLLPAALDDTLAVLDALARRGFSPARVALAGDSAGAALALGAIVARLQSGAPAPCAAYLMSAWTDLTASGESYETHSKLDPIHQRPMIQAIAKSALGPQASVDEPRLSPLFASPDIYAALPPLLMQVGERETLVSDTQDFVRRARAAGADATAEIWPGMIHVFQQFPDELPQAREAVAAGARFLSTHLRA
jgi:acetyl esterase/lipase